MKKKTKRRPDNTGDLQVKKKVKKKAGKRARGPRGRFPKGQSGNPKGRPPGARNRTTLALEAILDGAAEKVTRKAIRLALEGDTVALRLCLDRLIPPRRERPIELELPAPAKASQIPRAVASELQAVGEGKLTPNEAATLTGILQTQARVIESAELEQRIQALEKRAAGEHTE